MSSFRKPFTVKRQSSGGYVNGIWVPSGETDIGITASKQPASGRDLENLPEGRRDGASWILYTDTELRTVVDGATPTKADQITLDGEVFEVMQVWPWENDVINHFRVLVAQIE